MPIEQAIFYNNAKTNLNLLIQKLMTENHLSLEEIMEQDYFDFVEVMGSKESDLYDIPAQADV